jgi:hypothetical protein
MQVGDDPYDNHRRGAIQGRLVSIKRSSAAGALICGNHMVWILLPTTGEEGFGNGL